MFLISVSLLLCRLSNSESAQSFSIYEQLRDSILNFSISGYNVLSQTSPLQDNIFYSPFIVYSVLLTADLGARGKTRNQICHTLNLCQANATMVHEAFGILCKDLIADSSFPSTLEIASGLFVQRGFNISKKFENAARSHFSTTVNEVDFLNDSFSAMTEVNSWVKHYTAGKIQAILHKNPSPLTKFMIVSAAHFRSQWKWQFDPQATEPYGYFYVAPSHRIRVPIMSGKMNVAYGHSASVAASILELPFAQSRISMFLLLADDPRQHLELNVKNLKELIGTMKKQDVNIRLPRFTIDASPQLTGLMWTLGIKDIFSQTESDLSGIATGLFVTDIVHRALIQVDEKGSVASAATAALVDRIGNLDDHYFEANRPFVFLVMDKQSGAVLFMGRVANF